MDNLSLNQYRLNLDEQKQAFDNQKFSASPAGKASRAARGGYEGAGNVAEWTLARVCIICIYI